MQFPIRQKISLADANAAKEILLLSQFFHRAHGQHAVLNRKPDIFSGKRHAIHALRIALVGRSRVMRKHTAQRLPMLRRDGFLQLCRKDDFQPVMLMSRGKAARRIRMAIRVGEIGLDICLIYTSPSPRDGLLSRMPSSA